MQDSEIFGNMPPTLAAKVSAYAQKTAAAAFRVCRKNEVPNDICEALILDAIDILRGQYMGLRATPEQMAALTAAVQLKTWNRAGNAPLCFIASYYAGISEYLAGRGAYVGADFLNAVVLCEIAKHADGDNPQPLPADKMAEMRGEAQRLYYMYAVLTAAEFCEATEAELWQIKPHGAGVLTTEQQQRAISSALAFQVGQRARSRARKPRKEAKQMTAEDIPTLFERLEKTPETLPADKTIKQYQNIAFMIANGVEAAPANDDRNGKMQPLWKVIEQQRQAAANLLKDEYASDDDKQAAAELITSTYAVTKVMDALQIIPQILPPDGGTTDRLYFDMSAYEYTRYVTGTKNPKAEQVTATLRATAFFSKQRTTVMEKTTKHIKFIDDDGKRKGKTVERDIYTNFQPLDVSFRTETENNVMIEKATRVRVGVHRLYAEGRTAKYFGEGKQSEYIAPARAHVLTIGQYYDFSTENEIIFRNIILSKPKKNEYDLLAAVFNYPKRQAEADKKAAEARTEADALAAKAEALDGGGDLDAAKRQADDAKAAAERAEKQAKYYINNHIGDDVKRLKLMFEKALKNGLITSYYDTGRIGTGGKQRYGRGVVWYWTRGNDEKGAKA